MMYCISDDLYFHCGVCELATRLNVSGGMISHLTFPQAMSSLADEDCDHSAIIIIDYTFSDVPFLFSLLEVKKKKACDNIIVIAETGIVRDTVEDILLEAVADCIIERSESLEKLHDYLCRLHSGQRISRSVINRAWATIKKNSRLTHREVDLLPYIISGKRNKEISRTINISEKTVSIHRRSIYAKLNVNTLAGLYHVFTDTEKHSFIRP